MKRDDGTCFAVKQGADNDIYAVSTTEKSFVVSLANAAFAIPSGEYFVAVSLGGSRGTFEETLTGIVEEGLPDRITVELTENHTPAFLTAGVMTITLAGKHHNLVLSRIDSVIRDLDLCEQHGTDPLQSTR